MKSAKLFHVLSVLLGLTGVVMWLVAIFAWPAGTLKFGVTREIMLICAILSFLSAIWLLIGAMHHITLAKIGERV
jgi:multisubunit Na+/H+ antiporter MnhF subunit